MSNLSDWREITYGGLFTIPLLAIVAMLVIDLLGLAAIFVDWLIGN